MHDRGPILCSNCDGSRWSPTFRVNSYRGTKAENLKSYFPPSASPSLSQTVRPSDRWTVRPSDLRTVSLSSAFCKASQLLPQPGTEQPDTEQLPSHCSSLYFAFDPLGSPQGVRSQNGRKMILADIEHLSSRIKHQRRRRFWRNGALQG